jgi:hypothetical protein
VANGRAADILHSEEHGEIVPNKNTKKKTIIQTYKNTKCLFCKLTIFYAAKNLEQYSSNCRGQRTVRYYRMSDTSKKKKTLSNTKVLLNPYMVYASNNSYRMKKVKPL